MILGKLAECERCVASVNTHTEPLARHGRHAIVHFDYTRPTDAIFSAAHRPRGKSLTTDAILFLIRDQREDDISRVSYCLFNDHIESWAPLCTISTNNATRRTFAWPASKWVHSLRKQPYLLRVNVRPGTEHSTVIDHSIRSAPRPADRYNSNRAMLRTRTAARCVNREARTCLHNKC